MVLVQIWPFFQLFFLGNIGHQNVFDDILKRKNAYLDYKNKKCKSRENEIFSKRLTHTFGPGMAIFQLFILGNIGHQNLFYDTLERKSAFLDYKNKKFKRSKN